jgi:hypothetical protein
MEKNQKYTREIMFKIIEQWKASGLSQLLFYKREKISKSTFGYWYKKYKQEKGLLPKSPKKVHHTFIPVEIPTPVNDVNVDLARIEISFPNGVQLNCPASIDMGQLKTVIKF